MSEQHDFVGRWSITRPGGLLGHQWATFYLRDGGSDDPTDPVLMVSADGSVIIANTDELNGRHWYVMTMALLGPMFTRVRSPLLSLVATEQSARGANYYFHDYVAHLDVDDEGNATWRPWQRDKPADVG